VVCSTRGSQGGHQVISHLAVPIVLDFDPQFCTECPRLGAKTKGSEPPPPNPKFDFPSRRLEATRINGGSKTVYHSKEAREEARAPCTWSTGTAKGLVRLLCDTVDGERSALVREAALEGLERVCARGDGGIVGNVLRGLMHEEDAVRKFTVEALRRLTSTVESSPSSSRGSSRPNSPQGKGVLAKGSSKALDMGKEKERADAVVDVTVNEVLGFLKKIMERVSKPAKLEVERDAIALKLTRPGVDKKPLIKEMERLEQVSPQPSTRNPQPSTRNPQS
jgi:hypothetical protein